MKATVGGGKKAAPKRKSKPIQKAAAPYRPATKTSGSRNKTPRRAPAPASGARSGRAMVGAAQNARVAASRRGPGPNLNPMDALSAGLRGLGGVGDAIRQSNPVDALYDKIGNRIKGATRR